MPGLPRRRAKRHCDYHSVVLIDPTLVEEIRRIERATGRNDVFSGLVRTLEGSVTGFPKSLAEHVARGDAKGAVRAAHTLKGTCRQLGAVALGDLFAEIEASAKAGDYSEAKRKYDDGAGLIAQSFAALKSA
jgi:HPt (histidine-containing phosphotransfer) domain-containing protein